MPCFLIDFSHPEVELCYCTDEIFGFVAEDYISKSLFEEIPYNMDEDSHLEQLNATFSIIKKNNFIPTSENEYQFDYIVALDIKFYEEKAVKHYWFRFE